MKKTNSLTYQFWCHVEKSVGCWLWKGSITASGYGQTSYCPSHGVYKSIRAHRVSWIIHFGEIPEGMCVCHACDTPLCVNPSHLWLGTSEQNTADREKKMRGVKGERQTQAKLSDKSVIEILGLKGKGLTALQIGNRYGVSPTLIRMVLARKLWKHVQCPTSPTGSQLSWTFGSPPL
jgi:hypothetical protein